MSEGSTHHVCPILATEMLTHDVRRFVVAKPDGYQYRPGQATEVSINEPKWKDQKRPFTFTSLNTDKNLEFIIKLYPEQDGVTDHMGELSLGDELIVGEPWGAITYRGPGMFLAGGAGVTPFIAILRQLEADGNLEGNTLLFSNKTAADIILEAEFARMLGDRAVFTLTREKRPPYRFGRIDRDLIEQYAADKSQPFYLCGPPPMVEGLSHMLTAMGAKTDQVVIEE